MGDEVSIRVNFSRPLPIFPLDGTIVLPQQVLPLHIFEPRYRQMVDRVLDGSGQIAIATLKGRSWQTEYHGNPEILPAVCVGQVVQHEKFPDGRYNILLQGVCRARIVEEIMPDADRLYRQAILEPIGLGVVAGDEPARVREWLADALTEDPLSRLSVAEQVVEYVRNDEVPTEAALELVAFATLTEKSVRYRLLAEGDVNRRATIVRDELSSLGRMIQKAQLQRPEEWPKGLSWN
ncbi:MAG: LON peptidase substrate-binding domain-containing protein [Planctomycetota bacterium]